MSLAAVEQEFTSWEELMSFGCFISAPSSTSLAAVEQRITIWKELMSFGCFISARQLNLMQPSWLLSFSTLKLNTRSLKFVSQLGGASTTSRSQVLPRKIGKCALNDPVFKFKIYSLEMQDLNTNTNLTGLLLVFDFGSDSKDFDQELLWVFTSL